MTQARSLDRTKKRRIEPYTVEGIKRIKCARCQKRPAHHQWQICADGNQYRGICQPCDVALNEMVLRFMRFKDWRAKMAVYKTRVSYPSEGSIWPTKPLP